MVRSGYMVPLHSEKHIGEPSESTYEMLSYSITHRDQLGFLLQMSFVDKNLSNWTPDVQVITEGKR